jgi:hypothetical protein
MVCGQEKFRLGFNRPGVPFGAGSSRRGAVIRRDDAASAKAGIVTARSCDSGASSPVSLINRSIA